MQTPKTIPEFLTTLRTLHPDKLDMVERIRRMVVDLCPEVTERIMYGGIMFSAPHDFGGVYVYANHISFEFSNGSVFDDPHNVLKGKGKHRRHLKFRQMEDIDDSVVRFFVEQGITAEEFEDAE